jgi:hypothetical protein
MSTLLEIEVAAEALPAEQKRELFRFLATRLDPSGTPPRKARLVRQGDDALLEAPLDAPTMMPENVQWMLADWP